MTNQNTSCSFELYKGFGGVCLNFFGLNLYVQNFTNKFAASLADNRMFEIIDSFIDGEITDEQCRHCLSATNLGNQYIFLDQKALERVHILEHCYLCQEEKEYYLYSRKDSVDMNRDKVKVARRQYRGQGKYIEEILQ